MKLDIVCQYTIGWFFVYLIVNGEGASYIFELYVYMISLG
jgi:hypothetical protein